MIARWLWTGFMAEELLIAMGPPANDNDANRDMADRIRAIAFDILTRWSRDA